MSCLKAALEYQKKGLSLFPCNPHKSNENLGNKAPLISTFKPYRERVPTVDEITNWWNKWPDAMIGLITGEPNDLTVIDADSEEAYQGLQEYLPDNFITRIAKTPNGYHIYFKYFKEAINRSRIIEDVIPGVDIRTKGGYIIAPPSVNLENGTQAKYTWLVNAKVEVIPLSLKELVLSTLSSTYREQGNNGNIRVTNSNISFEKGSRDDTLFHLANCLMGKMPVEEIEQYLVFIAAHCSPPFSQKEINTKIQSALKRDESKNKSIAQEVREIIEVTSGNFRVTEVERMVTTVTGNNKAVLMQLSRMVKEGLLERVEKQPGVYRKVEGKFQTIRLDDLGEGELFDIRLPFGIEQYLEVMPKDLIVFAGVPNAGKTAIMLETCRLNMRRHKCFYFSSEMGAHNCKRRLSKHESCGDWPFEFIDDFPNFIDIIQPDNINFIDYIEETEGESYRIPGLLAKIQRKLKNGIAIVALQKNPDKEYAVGGHQTKAKPALYCTIDPDYPGAIMRIVKAKNYKDENPNGYMMNFKIVKGINLIPEGIWQPEIA